MSSFGWTASERVGAGYIAMEKFCRGAERRLLGERDGHVAGDVFKNAVDYKEEQIDPKVRDLQFMSVLMYRFMPKQLGIILAEYLSVVRPLEVFLSEKFKCKGAADLNEFMWADHKKGVWDGEFLSDLLQTYTSEHGMRGLGFQEYRQVATAFMEKHLKYKVDDSDNNVNTIFDVQAGHSSRTAGMEYARSTEDHRQVGREAMHKFFLVSMQWHDLLLVDELQLNEDVQARSSGNNSMNLDVPSQSLHLRSASYRTDTPVGRSGISMINRGGEDGGTSLTLSAGALNALRGLYDDSEAQFKSEEQAEAVRLAMKRSGDILVILPTGGGKSVIFMAPAWIEKELTTVVIVPNYRIPQNNPNLRQPAALPTT